MTTAGEIQVGTFQEFGSHHGKEFCNVLLIEVLRDKCHKTQHTLITGYLQDELLA